MFKAKKIPIAIILLVISSLLFQYCLRKGELPNFILITLDTQRADYISAYSPDNASTPNIDSLADKGVLYENCYSIIPITLPSHASIFFSQPPHTVRNYNNGQIIKKKRKRPSLVNVFKGRGFATAAFVSLGVLKAKFGLDEAFDLYQDDFPKGRWYLTAEEVNQKVFPWLEQNKDRRFFIWIHYSDPHDPYAPPDNPPDLRLYLNNQLIAEYCLNKYTKYEVNLNIKEGKNRLRLEVENEFEKRPNRFQARFDIFDFSPEPDQKDLIIDLSRGWLINREKRNFLCKEKGYVDIETKKSPTPIKLTFRGKLVLSREGTRDFYRREVEYMDREIGRLWGKLEELKLMKRSHILLVGDHGEGLADYRSFRGGWHIGHIHFLYNIYMKVPLIIYKAGNSPKGLRKKESVTLLDIAPTIMEMMGFKNLRSFQGRNLFTLKEGEEITILEETYKPEAVRERLALIRYPWHLIFTPEIAQYELFDLREDPDEKTNIYQESNLLPEVQNLKQELDSRSRKILKDKQEAKITIDQKSKEMLKALGYIR
jgi:arylsulfatase A-like enzyme